MQIDNEFLSKFKYHLSSERLEPYHSHLKEAQNITFLYQVNIDLSANLYVVLQYLEIMIRSGVHNQLTERFGEEWYNTIELTEKQKNSLETAKKHLHKKRKKNVPSQIVSQLTFGFWRNLFCKKYDDLWRETLRNLFSYESPVSRRDIEKVMHMSNILRNRIAHHERIIFHKFDLLHEYENILKTISLISPEMAKWVENNNKFREIYSTSLG